MIQSSPLSKTPLGISKSTAKEIYEKSKADIEFIEERYFEGKRLLSEQYNTLKTSDFDDTLSISTFTAEQLSEYLLSCMHILAERAVKSHQSVETLVSTKDHLDQELYELKQELSELKQELSEIKNSKAWKSIVAFRRLRAALALHK